MDIIQALEMCETALGENLQFISDKCDLEIRQNDIETLAKLKQLNNAWVAACKALHQAGAK